ncbi:nitrite reductase/ring-hydroxylating ferredoxin subunit [Actinophytocola oryzae]|uniref:Cytochrome bc1 complex Rieske iron-sulfur subunit n=2 Tax=Actinophytocola oryzae TaxID=502181 RepID=A0A4V3FSW2_9PSEU|nr:nitrite reductase/ring-hydroxylating ferredoxin subunit [Actinophytocola oryzae]
MVALVVPGAVLAACSDSSDSSGGATTNGSTPGGSTPGGGGAAGLTAVADVPEGGGVIVANPEGGMLLIVREGDEVKAYNAACTHMGTTVEAPVDGVSTCPNHGSQFNAADGSVKKGPAAQPLATVDVKVEGDQVVLA